MPPEPPNFFERLRARPLQERRMIAGGVFAGFAVIAIGLFLFSLPSLFRSSAPETAKETNAPSLTSIIGDAFQSIGSASREIRVAFQAVTNFSSTTLVTNIATTTEKQSLPLSPVRAPDSVPPPETSARAPSPFERGAATMGRAGEATASVFSNLFRAIQAIFN
jgi:hypothetical protein